MNKLTRGQTAVLILAALPMIGVGIAGAVGTYANATSVLHRSQTALGVVAAGEGATLVAALVMIGVTMLGQSAPSVVRAALWLLPAAAAAMGITIAPTVREAVVYGLTPLAMTASAEGISFLARRIVVHRTGIDAEAQRRNAETVQRLAYHRARAVNHPSDWARKSSARKAWRLAKQVGVGDAELGTHLVEVQRERLRDGADAALLDMYGTTAPALPPAEVTTTLDGHFADVAEVVAEVTTVPEPAPVAAEPLEVVMPPVTALPPAPYRWDDLSDQEAAAKVTTALPAQEPRRVVTETVTVTPVELRRQARKLHREAVRSTRRPVTIQKLQDELGLSRREATELRREVVKEDRS